MLKQHIKPSPSYSGPSQKDEDFWKLLGLVVLLGLTWRLGIAATAPWYWDEGYVAELAQSLVKFERPHLGGLWQDGFFPLSTSFLAPYSASPFTLLPGLNAMQGVRLWGCLLEAGSILLVGLLGRALGGRRLGIWAGLAYALQSYGAAYGGRGFYHHFSVFFMLASLLATARHWNSPSPKRATEASLCAGIALASSYWLWWLPASVWISILFRTPNRAFRSALLMALPVVLAMAINILPDPAGALWSIRGLLHASNMASTQTLGLFLACLSTNFTCLPFFIVGLGGLILALFNDRRYAPLAFCLLMALSEPTRQRGLIFILPYPFMPAGPLAALGAGWVFHRLSVQHRAGTWLLLLLLALVYFKPHDVSNLNRWSFQMEPVAQLREYLDQRDPSGQDLVCAFPNFNWYLRKSHKVCEVVDIGASEGYPADFYLPGVPSSRLAMDCRLEKVRFIVGSRLIGLGKFFSNGVGSIYLRAESEGWPMVYNNRTFKVFENPRFAGRSDPDSQILPPVLACYESAAGQCQETGQDELVRFAEKRMQKLASVIKQAKAP